MGWDERGGGEAHAAAAARGDGVREALATRKRGANRHKELRVFGLAEANLGQEAVKQKLSVLYGVAREEASRKQRERESVCVCVCVCVCARERESERGYKVT